MSEEAAGTLQLETDDLDEKTIKAFPGKTVRKDLTALMRRGANVPTFVLEYLLGMYCSTDDPAMVVLRLSGSVDELRGLEDILRVAKNAGARKVLLPLGCIKDLQSIPQELMASVSPDFYPDGDAVSAAKKALGI